MLAKLELQKGCLEKLVNTGFEKLGSERKYLNSTNTRVYMFEI